MAMAIGIIGGVISAIGSLQQANAQAASAEYNAKVAERNKRAVKNQTESEIEDRQVEHRRQLGSMRASYGASGLQMEGSPLDVLEDTATEQAFDISKIRYQGAMKAEGYSEQAALYKLEAKSAKTAGWIGAGSALIGGLQSGLANMS